MMMRRQCESRLQQVVTWALGFGNSIVDGHDRNTSVFRLYPADDITLLLNNRPRTPPCRAVGDNRWT